jgi:hypothetical protein
MQATESLQRRHNLAPAKHQAMPWEGEDVQMPERQKTEWQPNDNRTAKGLNQRQEEAKQKCGKQEKERKK